MRNWNEIIGNKRILDNLKSVVAENRPAHAIAFHGPDGIGKRTAAEIFAKSLQCENRGDSFEPCGTCRSCLQFDSGNQPDVIRVTHEKAAVSVDDIRNQVVAPMQILPYSSPRKIFIMDEAEKMNEQAQNALLKTLEEPPEYGIIILLTNNMESFLETIRSRVVCYDFMPVGTEDIKSFLIREKKIPDYQARIAAGASGGCPGLAYVWADSEEFAAKREYAERILRKIGELPAGTIIATAKENAKNKDDIEFFLRMLENWIRDVLVIKSGAPKRVSMFTEEMKILKKQADSLEYGFFGEISAATDTLRERLRYNVNAEISFEDLLLKL